MPDDATLDRFATAAEATDDETATDDPPVGDGDATTVEPTTATYRFDPDGGVCDDCGTRAERRWLTDDGAVCDGCKPWHA